jgi:hypothetical protein
LASTRVTTASSVLLLRPFTITTIISILLRYFHPEGRRFPARMVQYLKKRQVGVKLPPGVK